MRWAEIATVDQAERRYATADLLAAEHELLTRATRRHNSGGKAGTGKSTAIGAYRAELAQLDI